MFGHGQVEGFREKYGMEFRRPKWEEWPNEGLIGGHDWRIFPLLHKRHIFADVESFLLYDFYNVDGFVNEDVFVFSNRSGDERGLVVYHNKFAETTGWIKTSAAYMDKEAGSLVQESLGEGLGLPLDGYAIFCDYVSHQEYIRPCAELREKGIYVHLAAYQCHAFLDWRFVEGEEWGTVNSRLNGAGIGSIQSMYDELFPQQEPAEAEQQGEEEARSQEEGWGREGLGAGGAGERQEEASQNA
jgi:hypothetical protein